MKNLAIIPARSGSKRIPNKNIKMFKGKPIIAYSIEKALKSKLFTEVMVSTDCQNIANEAIKYGARVPFLRSGKNSNDFATINDVINEVIDTYSDTGEYFSNFCCIFPTSPLMNIKKLVEAYDKLLTKDFDSVFSVLKYSYPIQRALRLENDKVFMINPENLRKRSQDLEITYHDAGQFYWMKYNIFKIKKVLWTNNSGVIELDEMEVQDIDTMKDWEIAEFKYQVLMKEKYRR
jgi:N-acylneuraminate cytidylyltransferase